MFNNVNSDSGSGRYFGGHLSSLRKEIFDCLIFAHININFVRNKFDLPMHGFNGNRGVLMKSETKLNDSFPLLQVHITGYSPPFRLYHNANGVGILVFECEGIPC